MKKLLISLLFFCSFLVYADNDEQVLSLNFTPFCIGSVCKLSSVPVFILYKNKSPNTNLVYGYESQDGIRDYMLWNINPQPAAFGDGIYLLQNIVSSNPYVSPSILFPCLSNNVYRIESVELIASLVTQQGLILSTLKVPTVAPYCPHIGD